MKLLHKRNTAKIGLLVVIALFCLLTACSKRYAVDASWGVGTADAVKTDTDGIVYAVTDQNFAVIFELPDREKWDLSAFSPDCDAIYLSETALQKAKSLTSLTLGASAFWDPSLTEALTALGEFLYPENTLTDDWAATTRVAAEINQQRSEDGKRAIVPKIALCRAARERLTALDGSVESILTHPSADNSAAALTAQGVDYVFADTWMSCYENRSAMQEARYFGIGALHADHVSEVLYTELGICVRPGNYEGKQQWAFFSIFVSPEKTGETADGLLYEIKEDGASIVGVSQQAENVYVPHQIGDRTVTDLAPGIFQNHKKLLSVSVYPDEALTLTDDAFEGCTRLRAIATGSEFAFHGTVPEGCLNWSGLLRSLFKEEIFSFATRIWVENDTVYAKSALDPFVLLEMPRRGDSFDVPTEVDGHPVIYIHKDAFANSPELRRVKIPADCAPAPELLAQLTENDRITLDYDVNSMTNSMIYTIKLAAQINTERKKERLPLVMPNVMLTRAARLRAAEIPQLSKEERTNGLRPDGSKYYTLIQEAPMIQSQNLRWTGLAESYQGVRTAEGLDSAVLPQFLERFDDTEFSGDTRTFIGVGIYYGDYAGSNAYVGSCFVGNIEGNDPNKW